MHRSSHALILLVLLWSSSVFAEPRIHIENLPESCSADSFFAAGDESWTWVADREAPLTLHVEHAGEEFVAKFDSSQGVRVLREKSCHTLMLAAASIAPLLWQQIEDNTPPVTAIVRPPEVSQAPSPSAPKSAPRGEFGSWFLSAGGLVSRGELPDGALGVAMGVGHRGLRRVFSGAVEYTRATLRNASPMTEVAFSKLVLRPKGCARFELGITWESCAAVSLGAVRAIPAGQTVNLSSTALYLGADASLGGFYALGSRYEIGLAAALAIPLVGRKYSFSPSPEVHVMSGPSAKLLFFARYFFSDRF